MTLDSVCNMTLDQICDGTIVSAIPATLDWSTDVANPPTIPTAAQNAAAVLDEAKGEHTGLLAGVALDTTVAKWSTLTSALTAAGSVGKWLLEQIAGVKTKTDAITFGPVVVDSPIDDNLDVTITRYIDYLEANGNAIPWTNESGNWCGGDLAGATMTFTAKDGSGVQVLSKSAACYAATGIQEVHLELSSEQTGLFHSLGRRYTYGLLIAKAGYRTHEITGSITVEETHNTPSEA